MLEYIKTHPEVVLALAGALFTLATKPRTPEEYEAIAQVSPRLAAFLKLCAAVFPDVLKAMKALKQLKDGSYMSAQSKGGAE